MYLSKVQLRNFRAFDDLVIPFQPGLTVLVGENNSGKSSIIDALRLLTPPLNGRRDIFCEVTDHRDGKVNQDFHITASFNELTPNQQGLLISALTDTQANEARLGLSYSSADEVAFPKPKYWAGQFETPPEAGARDLIRHIYLPPLRDAKQALASGNPTRIYTLLKHFLDGDAPETVAKNLGRSQDHEVLSKVSEAVQSQLLGLTSGVREQDTSLGFNSDERLIEIARDLRFKLADKGVKPQELRDSGLGFANLLYMSTIAVELAHVDKAELTLFLVEEPEAHLHPQLQAAVLDFLNEQTGKQVQVADNEEAQHQTLASKGKVQVIVATHSPNLTAWVPNKKLVVMRSIVPLPQNEESKPTPEPPETDESNLQSNERRVSRCVPLSLINLTDPERRKIDRYLDVTKSALLFGGRCILVEGIAEALLLPVIASHITLKDDEAALRRFRTSTFVPIAGVDFEPYVKMLLTSHNEARLSDRVIVITDGDRKDEPAAKYTAGELRVKKLVTIAESLGCPELLTTHINTYTLEPALISEGNDQIMKEVYLALHRKSEQKWDDALALSDPDKAQAIKDLFANTPKGDFAHLLAQKIEDGEDFKAPKYLEDAIKKAAE